MIPLQAADVRNGTEECGTCPLGTRLALIWYFFAMPPLFPLGMRMFMLCQCILGCVAFKIGSTEIALSLRRDSGLLDRAELVHNADF